MAIDWEDFYGFEDECDDPCDYGDYYEQLIEEAEQTLCGGDYFFKQSKQKPSSLRCPFCGSTLYYRVAKRGRHSGKTFLGCGGYPNCHYTKNV